MMKRLLYVFPFLLLPGWLLLEGLNHDASTRSFGSPGGYTGSPGDAVTCGNSSCHNDNAETESGWITTDIPASGYVPGQTYTVTAKAKQTGINTFGFEVTSEDGSGNKVGNMIITNSTETSTANNGNAVTHTSSGISSTDSMSWSFDWTAPSAGTGQVTFYGAFNLANGDGSNAGDDIRVSSTSVSEDISSSITVHNGKVSYSLRTYPNPVSDRLYVELNLQQPGMTTISFRDIQGRMVGTIVDGRLSKGKHQFTRDLAGKLESGIYSLEVRTPNRIRSRKIVIQ